MGVYGFFFILTLYRSVHTRLQDRKQTLVLVLAAQDSVQNGFMSKLSSGKLIGVLMRRLENWVYSKRFNCNTRTGGTVRNSNFFDASLHVLRRSQNHLFSPFRICSPTNSLNNPWSSSCFWSDGSPRIFGISSFTDVYGSIVADIRLHCGSSSGHVITDKKKPRNCSSTTDFFFSYSLRPPVFPILPRCILQLLRSIYMASAPWFRYSLLESHQ